MVGFLVGYLFCLFVVFLLVGSFCLFVGLFVGWFILFVCWLVHFLFVGWVDCFFDDLFGLLIRFLVYTSQSCLY